MNKKGKRGTAVAMPIIGLVTIEGRITIGTVDTETAPMIYIVITRTSIIGGIGTTIRAIGGLGINGIDTQDAIQTYTDMEDITVNMDI